MPIVGSSRGQLLYPGHIAGIVTEYVPAKTDIDSVVGLTNNALVNSGYGVAEPIDFAIDLMRQMPQ